MHEVGRIAKVALNGLVGFVASTLLAVADSKVAGNTLSDISVNVFVIFRFTFTVEACCDRPMIVGGVAVVAGG